MQIVSIVLESLYSPFLNPRSDIHTCSVTEYSIPLEPPWVAQSDARLSGDQDVVGSALHGLATFFRGE